MLDLCQCPEPPCNDVLGSIFLHFGASGALSRRREGGGEIRGLFRGLEGHEPAFFPRGFRGLPIPIMTEEAPGPWLSAFNAPLCRVSRPRKLQWLWKAIDSLSQSSLPRERLAHPKAGLPTTSPRARHSCVPPLPGTSSDRCRVSFRGWCLQDLPFKDPFGCSCWVLGVSQQPTVDTRPTKLQHGTLLAEGGAS